MNDVRMHCGLTGLLAWLLLALFAREAGAAALVLDAAQDIHRLGVHTQYLHDPDGQLELDAIRGRDARGEFLPMPLDRANFGYVDGAQWFRFEVENRDDGRRRWMLVIEYALLDHVTLFRIRPDGQVETRESGDRLPFGTRTAALRYLNFGLELPAGEPSTFYLRVRSQSSMQVPLVIARPDAYLQSLLPAQIGLGIYYGILLALLLYNLILWVSVRDRNFLWYVLYSGALGMLLLGLNGIAFQHLWPDSPDWGNLAVPIAISLSNLTMLQFSRSFLELHRYAPRGDLAARGMMLLAALPLPGAFVLPYRDVVQYQTVLALVIALVILACALLCLRRYPPARHFLLAWSALLVGVMVYAAVSLGLLPKVPLTEYSMQIGSAAEMILLSFALAYRINVLKAENERIHSDAREQLEARVRARTAELDATLHRLEDANRRLHDFSRRDGLTGVYNRRHLDDVLMQHCQLARENLTPLALLMIDVDHFKQINDRHGHLVGDDCLAGVAQALDRRVRDSGGVLARYGGEEFAVVLPGASQTEAERMAEALRNDVATRLLKTEAGEISLTISVGLLALPGGYPGVATDILRRADAALYEAKRAGRNRVVVATLS